MEQDGSIHGHAGGLNSPEMTEFFSRIGRPGYYRLVKRVEHAELDAMIVLVAATVQVQFVMTDLGNIIAESDRLQKQYRRYRLMLTDQRKLSTRITSR